MDPSSYVQVYLNIPVALTDGVVKVAIRNYLQDGKGGQSDRAKAQKDDLLKKIAKEVKAKGPIPPAVFYVDDYEFYLLSVQRTFIGKAAPDEIQDTLWLASRFGLVNSGTVDTYCNNNLGVDCGGFVANLWGIGYPDGGRVVYGSTGFKPRAFWEMNRSKRRKKASEIEEGDAIIFFSHIKNDDTDLASVDASKGGEAFHIGVVGGKTLHGDSIDLTIVESSGGPAASGGNGVNVRTATGCQLKTAKGLVYVAAGKNAQGYDERLYFVGKACNMTTYLPRPVGDDS
jgi:hypothetical protein